MQPDSWACQSVEPCRLLAVGVMPTLRERCLCVQQPVNAGEDADGSSPGEQGLACDELASPRGEGAGSHGGLPQARSWLKTPYLALWEGVALPPLGWGSGWACLGEQGSMLGGWRLGELEEC